MTNREQIAWAFGTEIYDANEMAEIVSDMLCAANIGYLDKGKRKRLSAWLSLKCDPETNNWGVLPK